MLYKQDREWSSAKGLLVLVKCLDGFQVPEQAWDQSATPQTQRRQESVVHKCLRIDLMQLCIMKISFPQAWVLGLNAWRNFHVRARKKVQVHLSNKCLLL